MNKLLLLILKKWYPIKYAKRIGVKVGFDCRLIQVEFSTEPYLIEIGNHVSATKVRFETHDGGVWCFRDKYPEIDIIKPIKIGNNVYIGYGAIILPGVIISDNVIIGAGSIVTQNIPENSVAVGIPAKVIKSIESYEVKMKLNTENTKLLTKKEKEKFYKEKFKREGSK